MTKEIPLTKGLSALVDDDDFESLNQRKWCAVKGGHTHYAFAGSGKISMHRHLLAPAKGQFVDHINGNGLDNRRKNLRLCSHAENLRNQRKRKGTTSVFKGVTLSGNVWRAEIEQDGERLALGAFSSEIAAAKAYDRAARIFFGKFARTNESLGLFTGTHDRVLERAQPMSKRDDKPFKHHMRRLGIEPRIASSWSR